MTDELRNQYSILPKIQPLQQLELELLRHTNIMKNNFFNEKEYNCISNLLDWSIMIIFKFNLGSDNIEKFNAYYFPIKKDKIAFYLGTVIM